MIDIDIVTPDEWVRWRDMRLSALREAPESFCSTLSEWENQGERRWRDRLADVSVNFIARLDGHDAGMVSAMASDQDVELLSMWVAPFARGRGVGDELVNAVISWSDSHFGSRLILRVLSGNHRAAALYLRRGFEYEVTTTSELSPASERLMVHAR
jgi:RimJ/RimL family protein N-acetyltransferase